MVTEPFFFLFPFVERFKASSGLSLVETLGFVYFVVGWLQSLLGKIHSVRVIVWTVWRDDQVDNFGLSTEMFCIFHF